MPPARYYRMAVELAVRALREGRCLALVYDGFERTVEVHSVGLSREGEPLISCYQVAGGSRGGARTGWKLLRADRVEKARPSSREANAPRPGYNRHDPAIAQVLEQL